MAESVSATVRAGLADRDALERPTQLKLTPDTVPRPAAQVTMTRESIPAVQVTPPKAATVPAVPVSSAEPVKPRSPIPSVSVSAAPAGIESMPESQLTHRPGPNVLREPMASLAGFMPKAPVAPPPAAPIIVAKPDPVNVKANASPVTQKPVPAPEQMPSFVPETPPQMKLLGTLFNTYIMIEYEDHLLLIDQHAVHERLLFDRWMKLYDTQRAGQEMLVPLVCQVTRREQALL